MWYVTVIKHFVVTNSVLITIAMANIITKSTYRKDLGLIVLEGIESITIMVMKHGSREIR